MQHTDNKNKKTTKLSSCMSGACALLALGALGWNADALADDKTPSKWKLLDAAPASASLSVDVSKPSIRISPMLYGAFFEEISRAGDGGLYAEMLQNRSFEDLRTAPLGWHLLVEGGAKARMALDRENPINSKNPTSLRLEIETGGGRVGIVNEGFKGSNLGHMFPISTPEEAQEALATYEKQFQSATAGIALGEGKEYVFSCYSRSVGVESLDLSLEKQDGTVLARARVAGIGGEWKKFELPLKALGAETNARLVQGAHTPGTVWLDMVSLFPRETFMGRPNGLRPDIAQMIKGMKPAFLRFPGGCFIEGLTLEYAPRWKTTIGDVAQRQGHYSFWGYYSSGGLGFHEYLQFCEDIGAAPDYVVGCGISYKEKYGESIKYKGKFDFANPSTHVSEQVQGLKEWVQDALDAIEYANGDAETTRWGAERAKNGHPAPFNLNHITIGNETSGSAYEKHYARFHDAIRARYPKMTIITCVKTKDRPSDIYEEHFYRNSRWFIAQAGMFDKKERTGPKIYIGEYATRYFDAGNNGNLLGAVGEAAYLLGCERNSDLVVMTSYAPLLANCPREVPQDWRNWKPNAIIFDSARVFGNPSYHLQRMLAENRGDVLLPVAVTTPELEDTSGDGEPNETKPGEKAPEKFTGLKALHASASLVESSGEIILKVVNAANVPLATKVDLAGAGEIRPVARGLILTSGDPKDENTFEVPLKVVPRPVEIKNAGASFEHTFPAYSVTLLNLIPARGGEESLRSEFATPLAVHLYPCLAEQENLVASGKKKK